MASQEKEETSTPQPRIQPSDNDNHSSKDATTEGQQVFKHVYKILSDNPFPSSLSSPPTTSDLPPKLELSPLDIQSGYIHLSTNTQVPLTAGRFFNHFHRLWILKLRLDTFTDERRSEVGVIKWEISGDHGVFPHLYNGYLGRDVVETVLYFERAVVDDDNGKRQRWEDVLSGLDA